jgi:hypothetical protein
LDDALKDCIAGIMKEKGLAQLGDAFVNLAYSAAKTRAKGRPFGERVPDAVLSKAIGIAGLPVPMRLSHGERGDVVEGLIALAWTKGLLTLEEAVSILFEGISNWPYESRSLERDMMAKAFSNLVTAAARKVAEAKVLA